MAAISPNGFTYSHLPKIWENHPRYGIVHRQDCDTCRSYRDHLSDAAFDNELSFQMAREDIKRQQDVVFSRGVSEGRSLQKLSNEAELREVREEIAKLRAQLQVAHAEIESLKPCTGHLGGEKLEQAYVGSWKAVGDWKERDSRSRLPLPHRSSSPGGSSWSDTSFATPLEILDDTPPSSVFSSAAEEHSPCASASSLGNSLPVFPLAARDAANFEPPPHSSSYAAVASAPASPLQASWQSVGSSSIRTPKFTKQVDKLIRDANIPGNAEHVKKIKALCAEAHLAKDKKTDLQKYLLVKWKTPEWVKGAQLPTGAAVSAPLPLNPRSDDPPETWVAYYTIYPASLPAGVRRDAHGKPRLADISASRVVARLRPEVAIGDSNSTATRNAFKETVVRLFSIRHSYEQYLSWAGATVADVTTFKPFAGPPETITPENVAVHFAQCGISITRAETELGPWARECDRVWKAKALAAEAIGGV
ncbi:hypothetical protein HWV62_44631 [Athelia sp. TMB]|nr:hypothetical protein HWV62_44631 [Athelia sp. TMB]